jgi:hypothetical protein
LLKLLLEAFNEISLKILGNFPWELPRLYNILEFPQICLEIAANMPNDSVQYRSLADK